MINIDNLEKDITNLILKYTIKYDPREYHFVVGDTAWILFNFEPVKIKIIEIEDFKKLTNSEDAYVYYWIQFENISRFRIIFENIKFRIWLHFLRYLKISQPKIHPKLGPGHAVLAGETIYRTAEEAILNGYLDNLLFNLTISKN